jgi:hypothetical protein
MKSIRILCLTVLTVGVALPAHAAWPTNPYSAVPIAPFPFGEGLMGGVPDGAGGVIAYWVMDQAGTSDVYAQRITADGTVAPGWPATGRAICTATGAQAEVQGVADGSGGAIIVWSDTRNGGRDIYAQHVLTNGSVDPAWAVNGNSVSVDSHFEYEPSVCSDGAGGAFVAWSYQFGGGDYDIYGARVSSAGAVTGWGPWYSPGGLQNSPRLVPDGAGGCVFAFVDDQAGTQDIRAMRRAANGSFVWGPMNVCMAAGNQDYPVVTSDGSGGMLVAWRDARSGSNIYVARLMNSGTAPAGWGNFDGKPVCVAPGNPSAPTIAADGTGGCYIAWSDFRYDPNGDVFGQHLTGSGAVANGWSDNGSVVSAYPGTQYPQQNGMVSDGLGGAILAWGDARMGGFGYYARRLLPGGTSVGRWPSGGLDIADAPNYTNLAIPVSDGAGNAIVVMQQQINGGGAPQLFAMHVDRFGGIGSVEPRITSIGDVRGDQGGHVRLAWNACVLDADPGFEVSSYWIWRQTPKAQALQAVRQGARWLDDAASPLGAAPAVPHDGAPTRTFLVASNPNFAWEYLASQPANSSTQYSYVAATASDSLAGYNPRTVFMVEARYTSGTGFWDSPPDSGYSVDNLPPFAPSGFIGSYASGASSLHWNPNGEADLASYRVYRGTSPNFVPSPANRAADVPSTSYTDAIGAPYYYKLSAVDSHGNESGFVTLLPSGITGVPADAPLELALHPLAPNPAHAAMNVMFALPRADRARIGIYDQQGRRVRVVLDQTLPAGEHTSRWDIADDGGRRVSAGVYFVRFEASGHAFTGRLVVY